jgi:hypothetical protein
LHHAIFGLPKVVKAALGEQIERKRETGDAVGEHSIVDVAATGVIAGERRRPLPHFAAAARVLVVAIAQRLVRREPESLREEREEHDGCDTLRQIEMKAAKASKAMSHHEMGSLTQV